MILRLFYSYFAIGILFSEAKLFRLSSSFPDPHFPASGPSPVCTCFFPSPCDSLWGLWWPFCPHAHVCLFVCVSVCVCVCGCVWCFMLANHPHKTSCEWELWPEGFCSPGSHADHEPQGMASEVGPWEVRRLRGRAPRMGPQGRRPASSKDEEPASAWPWTPPAGPRGAVCAVDEVPGLCICYSPCVQGPCPVQTVTASSRAGWLCKRASAIRWGRSTARDWW